LQKAKTGSLNDNSLLESKVTMKVKETLENRSNPVVSNPPDYSGMQATGFVTEVSNAFFLVACKEGQVRCHKAEGCLIQPVKGDFVLIHREIEEIGWIISVLMRGVTTNPSVVQLPSNSIIKAEDDVIHFSSVQTTFDSTEMKINTTLLQVNSDNTQFLGKLFQVTAGTFKAVGQTFTSIADRITQYSHTYFRTTTGIDKTDAKQLEIRAEQLLRIKGDYTLIEGDSLVKAKGSQIHFG
jgi:hypothetical protein